MLARLKLIFKLLAPNRSRLALTICVSLCLAAAELSLPLLAAWSIDLALAEALDWHLGLYLALMFVMACAHSGLSKLLQVFSQRLALDVAARQRTALWQRLLRLPLAQIDCWQGDSLATLIILDSRRLSDGLVLFLNQFFVALGSIVCTLLIMLSIDRTLALLVLLLTLPSLVLTKLFAQNSHASFAAQSTKRAELANYTGEILERRQLSLAYGLDAEHCASFASYNEQYRQVSAKAMFISALANPSSRFINHLVFTLLTLLGGLAVIAGHLSVGLLSAILAYTRSYSRPFAELSNVLSELQSASAALDRIAQFEQNAVPALVPSPFDNYQAEGDLRWHNVSFSYVPKQPVLRDLNLRLSKGMKIALVGPTGSGKSTFVNLLLRFYEPDEGSIYLDQYQLSELPPASIRRNFGLLLQDAWLKTGSIAANIALAKPDASPAEIISAATAAKADYFIRQLPQAYDTLVDNQSTILSAGQKQLLALARLMLQRPPLLILDEATSFVDLLSEKQLQKSLRELCAGRSTLVVAHRLAAIIDADLILVLKDGQICEQGTHQELLSASGFYAELYRSQNPFGAARPTT